MPVGIIFEDDGFTEAQYEAVNDAVGEAPMEGCLLHIAGPTDTGWRVIEVWDSEQQQRAFQDDRLNSAFDAAGLPRYTGTFFSVHAVFPPAEALQGLATPS